MAARQMQFLDFLAERGALEGPAVERARGAFEKSDQPVSVVLTELGLLAETDLAREQAAFLGLRMANAEDFPDASLFGDTLKSDYLLRARIVPIASDDEAVTVATATPFNDDAANAVGYFLKRPIEIRVAATSVFEAAFKRLYGDAEENVERDSLLTAIDANDHIADDDLQRLKDIAREAPVIKLVNRLISSAVEQGASDIHIEPLSDAVRIRYRLDGALQTTETLAKSMQAGVITRVKILAKMNIAERRLPQDGRIKTSVRGRDIDLRISSVPTIDGEGLVLRILDQSRVELNFSALGFDHDAVTLLRRMINHPNGLVLVTGPTGSGKTTTLYAALKEVNREDRKLFTVEDPIEYQLPGVSQIQVKPSIGLDFASSLRAILRQDPDIVMVGEIRELETGRMAIQSALTGHLVLSTVHTNSAAETVNRLIDMGLEDYLLAATLRGIIAQRLVRRLCRVCAEPDPAAEAIYRNLSVRMEPKMPAEAANFRIGAGCEACRGTGYSGRTTIFEAIEVDDAIRRLILKQAAGSDISAAAQQAGNQTLFQSGLAKAYSGETSLQDVFQVAGTPSV